MFTCQEVEKTDTGLEIAYNLNDLKMNKRLPQGSVVKNVPSNAGDEGLILVRELGSDIPRSN